MGHLWDTHVHLTMGDYDGDRQEVLSRARQAGVERLVIVGMEERSGRETWDKAIAFASSQDDALLCLAVHPHDASIATESHYQRLARLAGALPGKLAAVGETGLDYHYDLSPREVQQQVFARFIGSALALRLPLVIHSREAWDDTCRILDDTGGWAAGGVFHCFGYGPAQAREVRDRGMYLGVGGVITFKNADSLRQAVKETGLAGIVLETDGPYLAPIPYRGRRNEPAYIPVVAAALAELFDVDPGYVADITGENAARLFGGRKP